MVETSNNLETDEEQIRRAELERQRRASAKAMAKKVAKEKGKEAVKKEVKKKILKKVLWGLVKAVLPYVLIILGILFLVFIVIVLAREYICGGGVFRWFLRATFFRNFCDMFQ